MNPTKRYLSLDVLKGLGILYLIFLHQIIWSLLEGDGGIVIYPELRSFVFNFTYRSTLHVLGLQIPLLAGISFFIANASKSISFIFVLKRALMLIGLGFFMNLLAWGPQYMFDWDVLQFIALAMVVSYILLKLFPQPINVFVMLLAGAAALYYADQFPFVHWSRNYFYHILLGDQLGEMYWPFVPWYALFAAGVFLGWIMHAHDHALKYVFPVGILFIALSVSQGRFFPESVMTQLWGPTLFKPSPFFLIGIIGSSFAAVPLLEFLIHRKEDFKDSLVNSFLTFFGRAILWIYLVTTVVGFRITKLILSFLQLTYGQAVIVMVSLIGLQVVLAYGIGKLLTYQKPLDY